MYCPTCLAFQTIHLILILDLLTVSKYLSRYLPHHQYAGIDTEHHGDCYLYHSVTFFTRCNFDNDAGDASNFSLVFLSMETMVPPLEIHREEIYLLIIPSQVAHLKTLYQLRFEAPNEVYQCLTKIVQHMLYQMLTFYPGTFNL